MYTRRWVRSAWAATLCVTCVACALPVPFTGREIVAGFTEQRTDAAVTRRIVLGLDVSLEGGAEGLRLGWSDVTLAHDTPAATTDATGGYVAPLAWRWQRDERTLATLGWFVRRVAPEPSGALLDYRRQLGLALEWGRVSQGVTLGWQHSCTLAVPPGTSGVWLAAVGSSDPVGLRLLSTMMGGKHE